MKPTSSLHSRSQALSFQNPTSRGGSPNKFYEIAPGWTTLYWKGTCLVGKPKDVCNALNYAIANMPEYSGLEIMLIEGDVSEPITLTELQTKEITMLPPPVRASKKRLDMQDKDEEIDKLKAEIETLKKKKSRSS